MANITLASLKFPGLSDTYVIPDGAVFVSYLTGTSAEIEAAYQSDTPVYCIAPFGVLPNRVFIICRLTKRVSATEHYFSAVDEYGDAKIVSCVNDNWSNFTMSRPLPSDAAPQPLGTAAAGSGTSFSRTDHVHAMPSASDVGAIAAPSSPATGAFLVYNGSAWVAQTLATWQGGNY